LCCVTLPSNTPLAIALLVMPVPHCLVQRRHSLAKLTSLAFAVNTSNARLG
jgi:hypothetical protein